MLRGGGRGGGVKVLLLYCLYLPVLFISDIVMVIIRDECVFCRV